MTFQYSEDKNILNILKICKNKVEIKREMLIRVYSGTSMAKGVLLSTIILNAKNNKEGIT